MNFRAIGAAIAACGLVGSAHAAFSTVDYGSYSVVYDDSGNFGAPSFNSEVGAWKTFGWSVPDSVSSINPEGPTFKLPQVFIKANPGYVLAGPVEVSIGNFVFFETANDSATAALLAGFAVKDENYPNATLVAKFLDRNVYGTFNSALVGTYNGTLTAGTGFFSNFGFWAGQVSLIATPFYTTAVVSQGTDLNHFSISLAAVPLPDTSPVPEPQTGHLAIVGGLALAGFLAWRRRSDS